MTDLCTEYKCSKETKRGNTKIKEIDIFETSVVAPSINDLFRLFGQVNFAKDVFLPQSSLSTYDYDCFILLNSQKQQLDGKVELKTSTSEQPNEHAFASSIDKVDPHQQNKYPTKNTVVLLSQHGHVLKCGENRTHLIPSIHSKCSAEAKGTILFSSIVVSIVFYGSYISKPSSVPSTTEEECSTPSSYHPGSLHATLLSSRKRRVYQNSINNELDNDYQELEKCPNTSTSLGKLVFCYRPRTKVVVTDDTGNSFFGRIVDPTATWVMHVEGLANPYTAYSITALAVDECYTISHVHRHISSFLKSQESLLVACHQKLFLLNEEESLEKRKLQLLTKVLLADSHMQRVRCEEDMKKISMPVKDVENNTEEGSPDDDRKGLEIEYIHWCRLIALRTHEATRIKEQIRTLISNQKHITREENSIIDLCNQLGFQLSDIESIMQFSNQVVVSNCSEKNAVEKKATWDPFLAPCVRARPPSEWSLKDAEWISIDQILNPQLWDKQQRFIPVKRIGTSDDSWDDNSSTKERKSLRREMSLRKWSCPFTNKQHIISIWKNNNVDLMNDDERICHNLLVEYNGPCVASYDDGYTQDLLKSNRLFHGSRWENSSHCVETNLCNSKSLLLQDDLWQRCRLLYRELKKTFLCTTTFVECCLLHGVPQRFSTPMLRLELGRELDKTLLEILNRKEDYASNSFFSDMKGLNTGIKQTFVAKRCDVSSSRIHRRNYGREGPVKLCRACRSPQCCWKHFVDMDGMKQLKQILVTELTGVQQQSNTLFLESRVARSARNGGTTWFNKKDLLYELESEIFDMERKIRFERVDKELHDCLASTGTIVEIEALHGYKALLSRDHAIAALKHEHTKLAANTAAREIVDEILNWYVYEPKEITICMNIMDFNICDCDGTALLFSPLNLNTLDILGC